jgi:hypothetical protein
MTFQRSFLAFTVLIFVGCASMYVTRSEIESLEQGMSERQVVERIGKPLKINRTKGRAGKSAQFVYNTPSGRAYVYFEEYELVSVQY